MPPRVFVNDVSAYTTRHLSKFLSEAAVGGTQAEDEDDDDEDGEVEKETYDIVASASVDEQSAFPWVAEFVESANEERLKAAVLSCQYVVYNIGSDRAAMHGALLAMEALCSASATWGRKETRTFVCLSSVMTWAKTRPTDMEDDTAPVLEDEYKRRRAHNKFRAEIELEKHLLQLARETNGKVRAYVVAAGMQYGAGEDVFHELFKSAWQLSPARLPFPGKGDNVVPTIHVHDLASVVANVLEGTPESKYILAIDNATSTLQEIAECISATLGTGKTEGMPTSDAPLDVSQPATVEELLTIDLRLESSAVKEMNIPWKAPDGLIEAIAAVAKEYRTARNLHPLKIYLHGPPLCGKEAVAEVLAKEYKLHLLSRQRVIAVKMAALEESARRAEAGDAIPADEHESVEADKQLLGEVHAALQENNGVHDGEMVQGWMVERLRSNACLNQGYVLDGCPATDEEATAMFAPGDDAEDPDVPDARTVPAHVFAFEADDAVLMERARALSESDAAGTCAASPDAMQAALAAFRKINTEDTTVLNWFDFKEIHPVYLEIADMTPEDVLKKIRNVLPSPRNYGPTAAEQAECSARAAEQQAVAEAEAVSAHAKAMALENEERTRKQQTWDTQTAEIRKQEAEALEASSLPLRRFLMQHVMPTLSKGLAEVCKTRPEDPVDSLAEYLFKNNPTIE